MEEEIFLGLDVGTNSCGWALTDSNYQLKKINKKDAWGVRLFNEAQTKEKRRLRRTTRRRLVRRKLQNAWLRELFNDEIQKVDEQFFTRLRYSNLWEEDKNEFGVDGNYSLFNDVIDVVYNDKNYYNNYKTVYHLRKELLKKPADDVRLLYLAIHSILTHRGHFLSGASLSEENELAENGLLKSICELFEKFSQVCVAEFNLTCENLNAIDNLLDNFKNLNSIREIKQKLVEDFGAKTKFEKELIYIFVSGKSATNKLFNRIDKEDKIEFNFDSDKFETETYSKLGEQLSEEELDVINLLKNIFSAIQLKKLLGDNSYICEAMVEKYEKHNKQLKEFKNFIRKYFPSKMSLFFRRYKDADGKKSKIKDDEKFVCNYAKYINSDLEKGKKQYFDKASTQEDFYAFIKDKLSKLQIETEYCKEEFEKEKQYFIELIDKNEFLLKIRSHENSVIPNGLYVKELKEILKTNSKKFEFLNSKDETGLTVADKIIKIIEFRVPYFVGPIGTYPGVPRINGWAEKEADIELRPWTLDKIVNFDKAEDLFIQRMTNKCTYLFEEDVLPKDSLLYSKFRVLNELNNLKINGNAISVDLKQKIFNSLFKNFKKVSIAKLKEFLVSENVISKEEISEVNISGIDKEFANNYSSFVTLKEILGENFVNKHEKDIEKIIKYHTIITDKTRLEKRLRREFEYLTDDDVKALKSLNFSKWGRLSEKFLTGIYFADKKTGEIFNVINALWQTNNNLMELMGSGFTLSDKLLEGKVKREKDILYEDIEELNCSPAVKRGAWQAIQIVNEIKEKIGKYPDKIFVEVSRYDGIKGDKGRKASRLKSLKKLYKDLKDDCEKYAIEYNKLQEELNNEDNARLRSDRLFLYFLQLGKCMYTGEPINIEDIYNENLYDIDHIIPQSRVKDDSLDNRVLVKKGANGSKDDFYPITEIHPEWVLKQKKFWKLLKDKGLISDEKFSRLVRTEKFTEKDANDFVNRQLVVTNQETKAVIDLLKRVVDKPNNIVFSKANFVSDFRRNFEIFKSRNINNFHHAKDAYLNIVVGDVLRNRFTDGFWKREEDDKNNQTSANTNKVFNKKVYNNRSGKLCWDGDKDISKVKNICNKNTCLVSYMPFITSNGMFYDQTIYKSKAKLSSTKASLTLKGDEKNPLSSIEKYGGYNSAKGAYFMVVEGLDKKGKKQRTIETVPVFLTYKLKDDPNMKQKIIQYLEEENDIKITKVVLDKLKYNSLLKIGNGLYRITGKTGDKYKIINANEWHIENDDVEYVKLIEKYFTYDANFRNGLEEKDDKIIISPAKKEGQTERALSRESNLEMFDLLINQLSKSIYDLPLMRKILNNLKEKRQMFESFSVSDQATLLNNVIGYIGGTYGVDLTLFGASKDSGQTTINKNISNLNISLICQSVTGLFQREIKLNGI